MHASATTLPRRGDVPAVGSAGREPADARPTPRAADDGAPRGGGRDRHPAPWSAALAWWAAASAAAGLTVLFAVPVTAPAPLLGLRAAAVLVLWLFAPGAVLLAKGRTRGVVRTALVPLSGLCALVAVASTGAWTGWWHPLLTTQVVGGAALALALVRLARTGPQGSAPQPAGRTADATGRRARPAVVGASAALLGAVVSWLVSLPAVAATPLSSTGLLVEGPWAFRAAVVLAVLALLLALRARSTAWAWAAVGGLVLVLRTTAAATSTAPMYAWTYKHLGVVDALQHYHHTLVDGGIYQAWPGMFAAAAWLSDASGAATVDVARWTTPVIQGLLVVQVAALARVLGARGPACAAAAGLAVAVNWVGQDYYAPQAVAMVLAAGILVLLVRARRSWGQSLAALAAYACLVPTHQLTPFWVLGVVVVLAVLRRVPWWLPTGMLLVVAVYLAPRLEVVGAYGLLSGFDPVANASGNAPSGGGAGRQLAGWIARSSVAVVWLATAAVLAGRLAPLVRRWRRASSLRVAAGLRPRGRPRVTALVRALLRSRVLVTAVLSFSAVALLGGQSYGGEAILRVVLYSAPGCAAVLGPWLARWVAGGGRVRPLAASAWALLAVLVTGQAYFGAWSVNRIQPQDVQAVRAFLTEAAPPAYLLPVLPDWPEKLTVDDLDFTVQDPTYGAALSVAGAAGDYSDPAAVDRLVSRLAELPPAPLYVAFSGSMEAYDDFYGIFPPGGYRSLREGLLARSDWTVVTHDGDLWVLQYTAPGWPVR